MIARLGQGASIAGALLAITGWTLGGLAALEHERARARWEAVGGVAADVPTDPETSDALYEQVLARRAEAERWGWLAACGAVLLAIGLGSRPPAPSAGASEGVPAPVRALLSVLVDAFVVAIGIALVEHTRALFGASHAGIGALVASGLTGGLVGGMWGSLAAGGTPGARILGIRVDDGAGGTPGALRAFAALLLWPFATVWAPIAGPFVTWQHLAGRDVPLGVAAPHLRWSGLRAVRRT